MIKLIELKILVISSLTSTASQLRSLTEERDELKRINSGNKDETATTLMDWIQKGSSTIVGLELLPEHFNIYSFSKLIKM